jgi:hypothetical protein
MLGGLFDGVELNLVEHRLGPIPPCPLSSDQSCFSAEGVTAAGLTAARELSSPEAMTSRAACRAKRRTKPARGKAAPRALSGGIVLEGSVTMALELPRLAVSEL